MLVGLTTWITAESIGPSDLAAEAETRGFESLLLPEHTHIPVSRRTPFPNGGELPDIYRRGFDPFVALAAAASATTNLRLGTAVSLIIEHDPIVLAKQVATLDQISGGRIVLGVGVGWNAEEMANHGTDFACRYTLMRERVEAMRAIWTSDEAEYHGSLVDFDAIWSWPKPVQRPGPPVLIGGAGRRAIEQVVEFGDGWIPPMGWVEELATSIATLRALERDRGMAPRSVTVVGVTPKREQIAHLHELGVERAVIALPASTREQLLPRLDRYADELLG